MAVFVVVSLGKAQMHFCHSTFTLFYVTFVFSIRFAEAVNTLWKLSFKKVEEKNNNCKIIKPVFIYDDETYANVLWIESF